MRDGMNLVAKEYVAAQDPTDPGVLILSKFAGAAQQLTGALIINPNDKLEVAEAIRDALQMSIQVMDAALQDFEVSAVRAWHVKVGAAQQLTGAVMPRWGAVQRGPRQEPGLDQREIEALGREYEERADAQRRGSSSAMATM